jgi:small subunit ribosomal protein S18
MPSASTRPRREGRGVAAGPGQNRRSSCRYCSEKGEDVDFTDVVALRRALSEKGRIRARRITGMCRRHQNQVGVAVKRAREMALLPYVNS